MILLLLACIPSPTDLPTSDWQVDPALLPPHNLGSTGSDLHAALPLLLFLACTGAADSEPLVESEAIDADADGFFAAEDCDDQDAAIHPGETEVPYDGVDNDCDARTPDDDLDGDGVGVATDCNDSDAGISPNATEVPGDGVDQDCDELRWLEADLVLPDAAAARAFCQTYDAIRGSLSLDRTWDEPDLTAFSCLQQVEGDLWMSYVWYGSQGSYHGLEQLSRVGGDLVIQETRSADMQGLSALEVVGGDFQVLCNDYAAQPHSLDGLSALAEIGGTLEQAGCAVGFSGLVGLQSLGALWVYEAGNRAHLQDFTGLEGVASMQSLVLERVQVQSSAGLEGLHSVGDLYIRNSTLPELLGFSGLEQVTGTLTIDTAYDLGSTQGLENLSYAGAISLSYHESISDGRTGYRLTGVLTDLQGFSGLQEVAGDLSLGGYLGVRDFSGFEALERVGGVLSFGPNDAPIEHFDMLTEVGGLSIESSAGHYDYTSDTTYYRCGANTIAGLAALQVVSGNLSLSHNSLLQDLSPLSQVTRVAGDFSITHNDGFSDGTAEALRDAIGAGNIGGTILIEDNTGP